MKKIKIIILCNLLILFATVFSAFCAETSNPSSPQSLPSTPVAAQPQKPENAIPPPLQAPENAYSYNPLGKPDPFKPFIDVEVKAVKKEKEKVESIFPLQRMGVESFKLVGIVGDQARRVAVVEDSTKKFYPLFVGTRIGLHDGKVTDILADRVTVDELDGKKVKRIILKLRKNI
ncbi:MAG: pilus assembly protein PilP [Deltaproteobacteria bacterium]